MSRLDVAVSRRATSAAQSILRETDESLQVDGKPGSFTMKVYEKSSSVIKSAVDSVVRALGVARGMRALNDDYVSQKSIGASSGDKTSSFDLLVIPAIVRTARSVGMNPVFPIAQLALESNWGKSTPTAEDGSPSFNYGGIKWASVNTPKKAFALTKEFQSGKTVSIKDAFAVFDSPSEFATAFITYMTNSRSSYRYPGLVKARSAEEYGAILQKGGYATDPKYSRLIASVASTATSKYALA